MRPRVHGTTLVRNRDGWRPSFGSADVRNRVDGTTVVLHRHDLSSSFRSADTRDSFNGEPTAPTCQGWLAEDVHEGWMISLCRWRLGVRWHLPQRWGWWWRG